MIVTAFVLFYYFDTSIPQSLVKKFLLAFIFFSGRVTSLQAAGGDVSWHAHKVHEFLGIPVTNSMLTTWFFAILLIVAIKVFVGRPQLIPNKGQAIFESVFESIRSVIEPIVGRKMVSKTLPLLLCLFIFILINNWTGLLPGVGAFGVRDESGYLIYWFRPANSDLNTTVALSTVAIIGCLYFVFRYAGVRLFLYDIFGNKADKKETPMPLYVFLSIIFLLVGFIEMISICIRPITLSMRLFGNVFGGETLLSKIINMSPWYVPAALPFYLLETLVGLIQALVFVLLTAVYIGLICNHEEEH